MDVQSPDSDGLLGTDVFAHVVVVVVPLRRKDCHSFFLFPCLKHTHSHTCTSLVLGRQKNKYIWCFLAAGSISGKFCGEVWRDTAET